MPKISIITPTYIDMPEKLNWLDEMIQSVLSQTIADWELVLIDDASPVSLEPIKQKYYKSEPRIRWLGNAQNFGPAMTRNSAVSLAQSDCILPLDSDDMLANSETLEKMYDVWLLDKTKIVYGNIQLYTQRNGEYQRSKIHQLAQYSIEGAMHLEFGIMPVTAMHSKEAHYKAGGWKPELSLGREDLEYWIAAGVAGYCGQKINHATLLYRKHEQSRDYKLKFENQQLRTMQEKIKEMHSDIYRGKFPMACCGKGNATANSPSIDPLILSQSAQGATRITEDLPGVDEKDWVWIQYTGKKKGSMAIHSRQTQIQYMIHGTGHILPVHKKDRGLAAFMSVRDTFINVNDPREQSMPQSQPEPATRPEPQVIPVAKPQLSTLTRVDKQSIETEVVGITKDHSGEVIIEPNPPQSVSNVIASPQLPTDYMLSRVEDVLHINNLGLSPILSNALDEAGYTVEKLAESTPEQLAELKGIGERRGETIINRAKELIDGKEE